jgi:hypothetical protein
VRVSTKEPKVEKPSFGIAGYLLAGALGATFGGLAVVVASRAIPLMMSRMMSNMMGNMMAQMGGEGCDPEEM